MPLSIEVSKKVELHFQGRLGTYQSKRLHAAAAAAVPTVNCLVPTSPLKATDSKTSLVVTLRLQMEFPCLGP